MRKLSFEYEMDLKFSDQIYNHLYQLRFLIPDNLYQKVQKMEYEILPQGSCAASNDSFNNIVINGQIIEPHDSFKYKVSGIVEVDYVEQMEEKCHPIYRTETSLTKYDDSMSVLIPKTDNFYEKMMRISSNIYYELYYTPKATNINTTASEAFALKKGVCQDFSHILIAIAKHLGYPARYVAGMMVGEGATHAWVEIYNNGKWHGFDPTNNRPVNNQYIVIAKGRDYSDCALDKGTFKTDHFVTQDMSAHVSVKVVD